MSDSALLGRAWDDVASGYAVYFEPRFRPWIEDAVDALLGHTLPDGPILVTCAGPGFEVETIARLCPEREVVAIDLSPRMVDHIGRRCSDLDNVRAFVGDASRLEAFGISGAAGLVSCFGLQQMPNPPDILRNWAASLGPGGVVSVVYWPGDAEPHGAFGICRRLVAERVPVPAATWETRLTDALRDGGAEVSQDLRIVHPIEHESAAALWDAMVGAGPLRALELRRGAALLSDLRRAFLESCPTGPLVQHPNARLLVARTSSRPPR